jgi:hypothetical protein
MTGPRDLSGVWDAVYAAAYVDSRREQCLSEDTPGDPRAHARYAAAVADEAVKALHRVRGEEPSCG